MLSVVEDWNKFHNEVLEQEWGKKYNSKLRAEIKYIILTVHISNPVYLVPLILIQYMLIMNNEMQFSWWVSSFTLLADGQK